MKQSTAVLLFSPSLKEYTSNVSRITNTVAQQPRWGGTSFGTLEIEAV